MLKRLYTVHCVYAAVVEVLHCTSSTIAIHMQHSEGSPKVRPLTILCVVLTGALGRCLWTYTQAPRKESRLPRLINYVPKRLDLNWNGHKCPTLPTSPMLPNSVANLPSWGRGTYSCPHLARPCQAQRSWEKNQGHQLQQQVGARFQIRKGWPKLNYDGHNSVLCMSPLPWQTAFLNWSQLSGSHTRFSDWSVASETSRSPPFTAKSSDGFGSYKKDTSFHSEVERWNPVCHCRIWSLGKGRFFKNLNKTDAVLQSEVEDGNPFPFQKEVTYTAVALRWQVSKKSFRIRSRGMRWLCTMPNLYIYIYI